MLTSEPRKRKSISKRTLLSIFIRDAGICGICGDPVDPDDVSVDHIVPWSQGGSDEPDNLRLAHRRCNSRKWTFRHIAPPDVTVADTRSTMQRRSLTDLREERGWSMRELARRADTSATQIHHWESGQRIPRADTMRRVAEALGVSMDEIELPGAEHGDARG